MKFKKKTINFPLDMIKEIEVIGAEEVRDFSSTTKTLVKEALKKRNEKR